MYSVTLRNGVKMPLLGYGVLQMKDQEECGADSASLEY